MTGTALTPRQDRFVQSYCGHLNASRAAREAGYSSSSGADAITGYRLLRNAKTKAAIEALQQAKARELELTRQDIISAVLRAIESAQELGKPAICLRGWVAIAKMLDFYNPETLKVEQDRLNGTENIRYVPTTELCRRISEEGKFRNADGSAMTPAQIDPFYQSLSTAELEALNEGRAVIETRVVMIANNVVTLRPRSQATA
jgi:hypothetical protein